MEKPNYRINEIKKDYFDAKIIAEVNLGSTSRELEERTFGLLGLLLPCPCVEKFNERQKELSCECQPHETYSARSGEWTEQSSSCSNESCGCEQWD